ncbi:hypothetical protein COT49_00515 [candidate division WWE3 bacterium CG08_land_8_20_14_0_20_40_13]|uniref:Uncharacterized protein n=1 Tax=candidate division WWE3 bacterium CG08_land_8_20_14_0_20_40_13 TaxID=1975084 RepID=A0A2H0XGP8_UNCKA|nr:MAG: hypothetical protein COT49_00515 [candidate division WWE3 bacterium CG08_land_8_20_14_0_20_40_13]
MAKKKNKKEIARLRAQVEILKAQLGSPKATAPRISKEPLAITKAEKFDTEITDYTPYIVHDFQKSLAVSFVFFTGIIALYLTQARWYNLIRF